MSDITARLRQIDAVYSASYPPSILSGVPDPHIDTLSPTSGSAAGGAFVVTVTGTDFEPSSVIEINQVAVPTTYVSATQVTTSFDPTVVGTVQFTVRNTSGQESNSVPFTVGALTAANVASRTTAEVKTW